MDLLRIAVLFSVSAPALAQVKWTPRVGGAPSFVVSQAFAHDTKRDVFLHYGASISNLQRQTWQLSGTTWTRLRPKTSPGSMVPSGMGYDSRRDRVVLVDNKGTWEWTGSDWEHRTGVATPQIPTASPLVFDQTRGVLTTILPEADTLAVWTYDGLAWSRRETRNAPSARNAYAFAMDPESGTLLLFGGSDKTGSLDETWLLIRGWVWIRRTGAGPSARYFAGMCYDSTRRRFVLFGGEKSFFTMNTDNTWEWNGTWHKRAPKGLPGLALRSHAMLWDSIRKRCVVFGGSYLRISRAGIQTWRNDWLVDYGPEHVASFSIFGRGCRGSSTTSPAITSTELPWIGESVAFSVTGVTPTTGLLLITGASKTTWDGGTLPFDLRGLGMSGCSLLTSIESVLPADSNVSYGLPLDPRLLGARYYHQVIALDAAANAGGAVFSAGAELRIGGK